MNYLRIFGVSHNYMEIILSRKPGLTNNLKFPIGFEIVDDNFKDVGSEQPLNLNFSNEVGNRIGHFAPYSFGDLIKLKNDSKELLEFRQILTVNFSVRERNWNLRIYPCEIEMAPKIKNFILKTGLSICKNWVNLKRNETWFEGQRFMQVGINDNVTKYCVLETQNEYIIQKQVENYNCG